jgi:hypothetical protein
LAPVDLSALTTVILGSLQETERKRRVAISIEEGIAVLGDCTLMGQLLENLFGMPGNIRPKKVRFVLSSGRPWWPDSPHFS